MFIIKPQFLVKKIFTICIAKSAMYCLKFRRRLSKLRRILRCDTGEIVHWLYIDQYYKMIF